MMATITLAMTTTTAMNAMLSVKGPLSTTSVSEEKFSVFSGAVGVMFALAAASASLCLCASASASAAAAASISACFASAMHLLSLTMNPSDVIAVADCLP